MASDMEKVENAENVPQPEETKPEWYILKVQVNRESRVQKELQRRVELFGLGKYVEEVRVPVERVADFKNGRKREIKRNLYPGYIMVKMVLNDETWFLMRETPGVGDFTGSVGKPMPMTPADVELMLKSESPEEKTQPKLQIPYRIGDQVKIKDGTFTDIEGKVNAIDELAGTVTIDIVFLNRNTPVTLEYWQVEKVEV